MPPHADAHQCADVPGLPQANEPDGRYVQVNDLGPVPSIDAVEIAKEALKNYRENKMFRQGIDRKVP